MRFTQPWFAIGILIASACPSGGWAQPSLEQRVASIERKITSNITLDTINQIESLQQEISELRGLLEEQQQTVLQLSNKQDKLYADLLKRVEDAAKEGKNAKSAVSGEYERAYKLMEQKKFTEAITAFRDFLWQNPDNINAANAYYWLGDLHFALWSEDKATNAMHMNKSIEAFLTVVDKYKDNQKAIDALLKLGMLEMERKNWIQAKSYFIQVKEKSPNTSRAQLAERKLQSIPAEK